MIILPLKMMIPSLKMGYEYGSSSSSGASGRKRWK